MKTRLKQIKSQIRINFKVFDSKQEKQTEDVVINIFAVFILKTCFLAHFYKNKIICMICYALWVTNMAAYMSGTVILLFFRPILRVFSCISYEQKALINTLYIQQFQEHFEGILLAEVERILPVILILPIIHRYPEFEDRETDVGPYGLPLSFATKKMDYSAL